MIKPMSNEFVIDLDDQTMFKYVKSMFWVKPKSIDLWKIEGRSRFVNSGRNWISNSFSGFKSCPTNFKFVLWDLNSFGKRILSSFEAN